jgi:hypothetical protein
MKKNLTRMFITTAILAATASSAQAAGPRPPFQMPVACAQTWAASTYDGHWPDQDSIDLGEWNGSTNMSEREPVLATADGTVSQVFTETDGSNRVYLDHGNGWMTHYIHLSYLPPLTVGQKVAQGEVIGHVGNSGTEAMHLHYTQLADGQAVRIMFDGTLINTSASNTASWNTWGTSNAEKLTSYDCPQESFTPFTQGANPSFLDYKPATGGMGINRINSGGLGVTTTGSESWSRSWTHFTPFKIGVDPYLFVYKAATGAVSFEKVDSGGTGTTTVGSGTWSKGWTHFMPLVVGGANYYIAYSSLNGSTNLDKINAAGNGSSTVWSGNWGKSWTNLVPFVRDGVQYFVAYQASTGAVEIDKAATSGGSVAITEVWSGTWSTSYTNIVPVIVSGVPHLLAYKNSTGVAKFLRVKSGGLGVDTLATETWATDWSAITPFVQGGLGHYLVYNARTGKTWIERMDADGAGSATLWGSTWAAGWT